MAGNKDDVPGFDISGKSNPLEEFRGSEQGTRYGKLLSRLRAGHWLGEERNTYLSLRHKQELIQDSLKPSAHVPKKFSGGFGLPTTDRNLGATGSYPFRSEILRWVSDKVTPWVRNISNPTPQYHSELSSVFPHYTKDRLHPNDSYLHVQTNTLGRFFPRPFVSLDIETDDANRPISISAQKFFYNTQKGRFELADQYQRFYTAENKNLQKSIEVHGLNAGDLKALRKQQFADLGFQYSEVYNASEKASLKDFLGSSVIVGHNIADFDLPKLGLYSRSFSNSTIDTLTAARNIWPADAEGNFVPNDLESVFQRIFHKSMAEAGLPHHDARSDTLATMMVLQEMVKWKGNISDELRGAMLLESGYHIVPFNSMRQSGLIRGGYNSYMEDNSWDLYMSMNDAQRNEFLNLVRQTREAGAEGQPGPGFHVERAPSDTVHPGGSHVRDIPRASDWNTFSDMFEELRMTMKEASLNIQRVGSLFGGAQGISTELAQEVSAQNFWRRRTLAEKIAKMEGPAQDSMIKALGLDPDKGEGQSISDIAKRISDVRKTEQTVKYLSTRDRRLDKAVRHGYITESQAGDIRAATPLTDDMAESYERLDDVMDDVILKNQKLHNVFAAMAKIPAYNFERWEQAFRGEVSGIKGAARGVVPNMIYSPLSRLTDASMNALTGHYADLKFGVRAGSAIGSGIVGLGGALVGSGVAAPAGLALMGAGSLWGAGTQIFGNYREAQITKWGEGIQNNLNTLGFIQDMALMPFKLLQTTIHGVIKGFGLLSSAVRNVSSLLSGTMSGGLTSLSVMGNPITGMTGVGYGDYIQSTSADFASLLGRGAINNIYNDFATQRMRLYTTGQLDSSRMVAASMLGVFDQVYGSTVNEEDAFTSLMDSLLQMTKDQTELERKQTYVLANMISPNLAEILQSAHTLGFSSFAQMQSPEGIWHYSNESLDVYRSRWQRAQWEYQFSGSQMDISKQRIATSLWNGPAGLGLSGRGLFNWVNSFMSSIADVLETGNWESLGSIISDTWEKIKSGAEDLWNAVKKTFGVSSDSFGGWVTSSLKTIGQSIYSYTKDTLVPMIDTIWDSITDIMMDKLDGIVNYLSTIKIDWSEFYKQVIKGESSNKPWISSLADVQLGTGAYTGTYHAGDVATLDTLMKVANAYDRSVTHKGWYDSAGKLNYGIYSTYGTTSSSAGYKVYTRTYEDFAKWISDTVSSASPEQLSSLNALLGEYGLPYNLTKENADQFLNFLLQSNINAAGAGALHPQWASGDPSPFRLGMGKLLTEYRGTRSQIESLLFQTLEGMIPTVEQSAHSILEIVANGQPVGTVDNKGVLTLINNAGVNVEPVHGDSTVKYMLKASTKGQQ